MATYRITAPNGATYEVSAPDGASEADVMAYAQKNFNQKPKEQDFSFDPARDMSMGERFLSGVGKAYTDLGRGVGQMVGAVDRQDVGESRKLDAPLMNTGAGMAGNLAGNVALLAPTALIPGANTVTGAATVGAVAGALSPSESGRETFTNIVAGGAGGAAGQAIANKVPGMLQGRVQTAAAKQAANAQKFAAARQGAQHGYVVPPADLEPGIVSEAVSGLSGKIKTAQVASQRNQGVTDRLAREALGLKAGDTLDIPALNTIRSQAGQAYDAVQSLGTIKPGQNYHASLDAIVQPHVRAGNSFPSAKPNPIIEEINTLRTQSFDAADAVAKIKTLRSDADAAYISGNKDLGKALKSGADALEQAIDDHLAAAGPSRMLADFREARKLIAKTYTVQKALNSQTGAVSAPQLAKDLAKGKPLSGELRTVAEMGTAFPKATQMLKEAPKAVSPLDFAVATGAGAVTANPMAALLLGARPVARSVMLSGPVQRRALEQGSAAPMSQAVQRALENRMMQQLLAPAGMAAGLEIAQ